MWYLYCNAYKLYETGIKIVIIFFFSSWEVDQRLVTGAPSNYVHDYVENIPQAQKNGGVRGEIPHIHIIPPPPPPPYNKTTRHFFLSQLHHSPMPWQSCVTSGMLCGGMLLTARAMIHFQSGPQTTWCTNNCYRKRYTLMSLSSVWCRFQTWSVLIWFWSDTSHWYSDSQQKSSII